MTASPSENARTSSEAQRQADPEGRRYVPVIHVEPRIRDARKEDRDAALSLFQLGSLRTNGDTSVSDDPEDLRNLEDFYIKPASAWLWIADLPGVGPVGMTALKEIDPDVAELRRLRVHPDYRGRGIGKMLVEHALRFCKQRSYLKVVLDTFVERTDAIKMFERFGFQFSRTRNTSGRDRHDFFLDLYRDKSSDDAP